VQNYLTDVAHKYELYKYARFNTTVEEARWNEETMKWETKVRIGGGKDAEFGGSYTIKSNYLVSGTGQLNNPKALNVPGIEDYQGKLFHSARWDWSFKMEGKRIAVVGTGSSIRLPFGIFLSRYHGADFYRRNDCSSCPRSRKDRETPHCGPTKSWLGHTAPRPGGSSMEACTAKNGCHQSAGDTAPRQWTCGNPFS
jgi:hypothetical protein